MAKEAEATTPYSTESTDIPTPSSDQCHIPPILTENLQYSSVEWDEASREEILSADKENQKPTYRNIYRITYGREDLLVVVDLTDQRPIIDIQHKSSDGQITHRKVIFRPKSSTNSSTTAVEEDQEYPAKRRKFSDDRIDSESIAIPEDKPGLVKDAGELDDGLDSGNFLTSRDSSPTTTKSLSESD